MSTVTVRRARLEDGPIVAKLFLELGVEEVPPGPERFAQEMCARTFVAEVDGEVLGYLYEQTLSDSGYVRHVVASPKARRSGIGGALFRAAKLHFRASGCTSVRLNVKPDNHAAIALYEREGLRAAYASRSVAFTFTRIPGAKIQGLRPCVLEPSDDARTEATFSLPRGQIAQMRGMPGRLVLGVLDERERPTSDSVAASELPVVGVACFDPNFPGSFPFRARSLEAAEALLDACRTHALGDAMNVVVEDDDALSTWLLSQGARSTLEIVHYVGALD